MYDTIAPDRRLVLIGPSPRRYPISGAPFPMLLHVIRDLTLREDEIFMRRLRTLSTMPIMPPPHVVLPIDMDCSGIISDSLKRQIITMGRSCGKSMMMLDHMMKHHAHQVVRRRTYPVIKPKPKVEKFSDLLSQIGNIKPLETTIKPLK